MLETKWRYPCGCWGGDGVCHANHEKEPKVEEVERLRGDLAKLAGCVDAYIQAQGTQVAGEAMRDLEGTLRAIRRPDAEKYGWPAALERVERERDELLVLLSGLAAEGSLEKDYLDKKPRQLAAARDRMVEYVRRNP
jgi:hypothetical protein